MSIDQTVLHEQHVALGAQMVDFGGWSMPIQYKTGIVVEHLNTRKHAGVFDVSHMGRIWISGTQTLAFLQHVLSNNAAALDPGESQYTMIPDESGGAIDDAYLYRFTEDEYVLVVNASNRIKDLTHFEKMRSGFPDVTIQDRTHETAMLSLQGPGSKMILEEIIEEGRLPEPIKNRTSMMRMNGRTIRVSRTGYTGEPLGFELIVENDMAPLLWEKMLKRKACPVGLGARDTLRLEAALPLYGHELGADPEGKPIPVFACPLAKFAVSLSPLKGDFVGRKALERQFDDFKRIQQKNAGSFAHLPMMIRPIALIGKGVLRAGCRVYHQGDPVGWITSGTMVPYWKTEGSGLELRITSEKEMRSIGLALVGSHIPDRERLDVDIRGKHTEAILVPYHLRSEAPPYARPVRWDQLPANEPNCPDQAAVHAAKGLLLRAIENTRWRREDCINLIPSEQTPSAAVRMMSILDPSGRYAEHKKVKAFGDAEVFYYQGVDFIAEIERALQCELRTYLGCRQVEPRPVSGQMANAAFFSAMMDWRNLADRKSEQRRLRSVMNHHIIKGGHLSAQPMGALRDFIARDPRAERPAVVNFPVCSEDPFRIDTEALPPLLERYRPELIILGKSMVLYREPVREIRSMIDALNLDCVLMYDAAHVLGLLGPFFQEPFAEGVDVLTGSTHKTYFGTQRGLIAADMAQEHPRFALWEAIERRAFPGSVSNHHLGTLLGLMMAAIEMNAFKDAYQEQVILNAKAFARALNDCGIEVMGDPALGFTETHQVIVHVGYGRGPDIARRLEGNQIIVNYQAGPEEEGFSAAGYLRMGVAEMTRFGMKEADFGEVAEMLHEVIVMNRGVKDRVKVFRKRFQEMHYCMGPEALGGSFDELHRMVGV
ncbi:glycine cleavage system aminomethyltransferase GcvT [Desulfatirhabdium butyrativorans]|uniref:glycine cleavage system aminomethyltransferase GcvT n=1 Tax=Desulfatirhabdium butyrativorans TaxID=340467 RepID=UPI0004180EC1|nr:glycine cleavage system aminomethyltransferase GcvT [Desulfatirhabdium butyrativorans]